jgi:amino acid permease
MIKFNRNFLITIPTLLISCFIACIYTPITAYISILGGFCSVIITFLYPGLLYVKNNDYPIYHWKNIATIIIVGTLTIIGYVAGIMTILDS